uniref:Uncharacterized protein n=1 Tax=uncultured myxobacterium HF0070_11L13 TaxID=723554 RepID=E7C207_9BACT|nr:hypothetical protein [uncultured myxobacterium HF0070_11L13]
MLVARFSSASRRVQIQRVATTGIITEHNRFGVLSQCAAFGEPVLLRLWLDGAVTELASYIELTFLHHRIIASASDGHTDVEPLLFLLLSKSARYELTNANVSVGALTGYPTFEQVYAQSEASLSSLIELASRVGGLSAQLYVQREVFYSKQSDLSEDARRIVPLVNGYRTVGAILNESELLLEYTLLALEELRSKGVVSFQEENGPTSLPVPEPTTSTYGQRSSASLARRDSLGVMIDEIVVEDRGSLAPRGPSVVPSFLSKPSDAFATQQAGEITRDTFVEELTDEQRRAATPASLSVPTPVPAPVSFSAPAPAPVSFSAPAPAQVSVPAPAPAPVSVPAPAPAPMSVPVPAPQIVDNGLDDLDFELQAAGLNSGRNLMLGGLAAIFIIFTFVIFSKSNEPQAPTTVAVAPPPPPPKPVIVKPVEEPPKPVVKKRRRYSLANPPPIAGPDADKRLREAEQRLNRGELESAATLLKELRVRMGKNSSVWVLSGMLADAQEDSELAMKYTRRAIKINSKDYRAWVLKGVLEQTDEDVISAADSYKKALNLEPGHSMSPELRVVLKGLES